jgi:hypothetical protein
MTFNIIITAGKEMKELLGNIWVLFFSPRKKELRDRRQFKTTKFICSFLLKERNSRKKGLRDRRQIKAAK